MFYIVENYITRVSKKKYEVSNLEKRLQTVELGLKAAEKRTRRITTRRQGGCHAKPRHDITRDHRYWSGTDPIPRTNLLERHRAMTRKEKGLQRLYLKNNKLARLSILILSKAYPGLGILSP
jgi:hypothetical protein